MASYIFPDNLIFGLIVNMSFFFINFIYSGIMINPDACTFPMDHFQHAMGMMGKVDPVLFQVLFKDSIWEGACSCDKDNSTG